MSVELTISSSQGRVAEWHDTIAPSGRRLAIVCPANADAALASRNEHWFGDLRLSDADKFNAIFVATVDRFNERQTRPSRKMGPESTDPKRQKTYYEGIVDGTFCTGVGDMKEQAIQETVLQIGDKDTNGTTDSSFNIDHWYDLKKSGYEDKASEYAIAHLNNNVNIERTKRILRRAVNRIASMDPEHLVVLRADYHGDEPCGTPNVHVAFVLRGTGYKSGMTERVGSVRALEQMGFRKTKDSEYGIVQLHERFKQIIEEEMVNDAIKYDYEPIRRKAPTGEKRKRSDVDVYRDMAAKQAELAKVEQAQAAVARQQAQTAAAQQKQQDSFDALCRAVEQEKESYIAAKKIYDERTAELSDASKRFQSWASKVKVAARDLDGEIRAYTVAELWQQHVKLRQKLPSVPGEQAIVREADMCLSVPKRTLPANVSKVKKSSE